MLGSFPQTSKRFIFFTSSLLVFYSTFNFSWATSPCAMDTVHQVDITYYLPFYGSFSSGTTGWTCSSTGGGSVNSYSASSQGWVGLQVTSSGGTATIGTYDGTTNSYLDISNSTTIIDQFKVCVQMRMNQVLAGTFQVTLYSPNTAQPLTLQATLQSDTGDANSFSTYSTYFEQISFLLEPISIDYTRVKNFELSYSVPPGATNQTTEVIIDQVYFTAVRVTP